MECPYCDIEMKAEADKMVCPICRLGVKITPIFNQSNISPSFSFSSQTATYFILAH